MFLGFLSLVLLMLCFILFLARGEELSDFAVRVVVTLCKSMMCEPLFDACAAFGCCDTCERVSAICFHLLFTYRLLFCLLTATMRRDISKLEGTPVIVILRST